MIDLEKAKAKLQEIIKESEDYYLEPTGTWIDSYNYDIVTQETADKALNFWKLIPDKYSPRIGNTPDASILFEFYYDSSHTLALMVKDNEENVSYAWLFDKESGCGTFLFSESEIPKEIIDIIERIENAKTV